MKIVKVLVILFSVFNVMSFMEFLSKDNEISNCMVCQRVVYQLKFDKIADCGNKACKNTCHKIIQQWNSPNSIFTDFQNDVLGKCDICFRAGFCSLTECDEIKAQEIRIVNEIVENGLYRGKIDKENGKKYVVDNSIKHLTPTSIDQMEKNVKKSLNNSIRAQNAEIAAKQVGSIVNNYVAQAANKQNDRINKRSVVYKNFILQSNIIAESTDKEIIELKSLLEDYAKMKDFKTVSPVANKQKSENERNLMKDRMKNLLDKVKSSLIVNLKLVNNTIRSLDKTIEKALNTKQTILSKNLKTLPTAEKRHLDTLETEINSLNGFKKPLEEVRGNFMSKEEILRSFEFKLNQ